MSLSVGSPQGGSYIPPNEDISNPWKRNYLKEIRKQETELADEAHAREVKRTQERNQDLEGEQQVREVRVDDTQPSDHPFH